MNLSDYPQPSVTVDIVVFCVVDNKLKILLVKRGVEPFKGKWAIPGGFVKLDESLEGAAKRELREETGLEEEYLEQLYTFGDVERDPRGRVISVAYFALVSGKDVMGGSDASEAKWFDVNDLPELFFDHKDILDYSLKRLRWKFEYTSIAFSLLGDRFTMTGLQNLYEVVFDKKFDKRNFRKKILSLNILKEEGLDISVPYRPPMMYSLKKDVPDFVGMV